MTSQNVTTGYCYPSFFAGISFWKGMVTILETICRMESLPNKNSSSLISFYRCSSPMQCFESFCGHRKKLLYKLSQVVPELITRGLLKVLELFGIQHKLVPFMFFLQS